MDSGEDSSSRIKSDSETASGDDPSVQMNSSAGNNSSADGQIINPAEFLTVLQTTFQQMQDRFTQMMDTVMERMDEMSDRLNDLEKEVTDLVTYAGGLGENGKDAENIPPGSGQP